MLLQNKNAVIYGSCLRRRSFCQLHSSCQFYRLMRAGRMH
jgi:hypothetical protein